jgi:hypothetical protein
MNREEVTAYALGGYGLVTGVYKEFVPAKTAWVVLGAAVLAHDVFCREGETLSEGADRALEKNKLMALGGIALVAGHLANAIPPRYDPIHQFASIIKR